MENSRKSSCDLAGRVADALFPVLPANCSILLGLSGGVDSVVLLHLLHYLASRYSWHLSALHVHHGISPQADAWATFCTHLCADYGIPVQIEQVDIMPLRKHGIEAAARKLRHAALDRQSVDFIALAHHQDDQAETMLLQLLRGAGLRGASAMPLIRQRSGQPTQLRPLLNVPRTELLAYAQQYALQWVEDESNADDTYPRNFLRHRMLPLLEQRFPSYRVTLSRSARHFAEASELLDQLAQQDALEAVHNGTLDIVRLQALNLPRAKNLLRYFLHNLGAPIPQTVQLNEMLQQLYGARQDAVATILFGNWQLSRYQGKAYAFPTLPELDEEFCVQWCGETALELPELSGTLHFESAIGHGLSLKKMQQASVTVRLRRGAERIRIDDRRPTRTLKNLLQEQGVPPWQRDRLPLLFCGETLVAVPGIGVECTYQATHEETGVILRWSVASSTRA
jgi:tRNA(Ile)-lysidine synthase